jgi:hypothetical protein
MAPAAASAFAGECGDVRALLGRRWQRSQAGSAQDSIRHTAKRRERRILPPATAGEGVAELCSAGAFAVEGRA